MDSTLIVIAASYPFSEIDEVSFLQREVEHLGRAFDSVILLPLSARGQIQELPESVVADRSLSDMRASIPRRLLSVAAGCLRPKIIRALLGKDRLPFSIRALRQTALYISDAVLVERWFRRHARSGDERGRAITAYTYWCSGSTLGCVLARDRGLLDYVVTRVHGFDLYRERYAPPFIPFQNLTVSEVDVCFPVSEDGRQYLRQRCDADDSRVRLARLGVAGAEAHSTRSKDGIWRIVSCSHIVPVKRVDLIARVVGGLAKRVPEQAIEWTHFGGGPSAAALVDLAANVLPGNVVFESPGDIANEEILHSYVARPVDLFVNLSSSEGIPVAIMEAISVGIPVLGLDVGGMAEIVDDDCGRLLPADQDLDRIAEEMLKLLSDPASLDKLAAGARQKQRRSYDADENFAQFAIDLRTLSEHSPAPNRVGTR